MILRAMHVAGLFDVPILIRILLLCVLHVAPAPNGTATGPVTINDSSLLSPESGDLYSNDDGAINGIVR